MISFFVIVPVISNDVAFKVLISIKIEDGVDYRQFIQNDEDYLDEEDMFVYIKRVGILRYMSGDGVSITDYGTDF